MEKKYLKALNFDLNTHQLKEHYPGANYRQAYDDLRRFFKRHQFAHRQGSGYISDKKLATADVYDLMDELSQQFPWIGICVNKIDVTNVGQQYDLIDLLRPLEDIVIDNSLIMSPAVYAMQVLQSEIIGEAERTGLTTEENVMELVKELRNEDEKT